MAAEVSVNMGNNKTCLIASACPFGNEMLPYIQNSNFIVACDAGYRYLEKLSVKPNLFIGDYDSAARPETEEEKIIVLPHVKDDTDTQYAASWAVRNGYTKVVFIGALGGKRLDHMMANLQTGLYLLRRGVQPVFADERTEIHFVAEGCSIAIKKEQWKYISIFSLDGRAKGVSVRGTMYELEGAELSADYPLGVSNEFLNNIAEISVQHGELLVFLTKDDCQLTAIE